eukprot:g16577.t1
MASLDPNDFTTWIVFFLVCFGTGVCSCFSGMAFWHCAGRYVSTCWNRMTGKRPRKTFPKFTMPSTLPSELQKPRQTEHNDLNMLRAQKGVLPASYTPASPDSDLSTLQAQKSVMHPALPQQWTPSPISQTRQLSIVEEAEIFSAEQSPATRIHSPRQAATASNPQLRQFYHDSPQPRLSIEGFAARDPPAPRASNNSNSDSGMFMSEPVDEKIGDFQTESSGDVDTVLETSPTLSEISENPSTSTVGRKEVDWRLQKDMQQDNPAVLGGAIEFALKQGVVEHDPLLAQAIERLRGPSYDYWRTRSRADYFGHLMSFA